MNKLLKILYRFTFMPYLERDKYFEIIIDEAMEYCDKIANKK